MGGHNKHRGTPWHEIVFPPSEVDILGVLVLPDVALPQGTPRLYEFNLDLETRPKGKSQPPRGARGDSLQGPQTKQVGLVTSCAPPPAGAEALGNLSGLMPLAHELSS